MQAFKAVVPLEWAAIGRSKGACMVALVCVALCIVHTLLQYNKIQNVHLRRIFFYIIDSPFFKSVKCGMEFGNVDV